MELKNSLDKLLVKDSNFNQNFKLHNCNIKNIQIKDTDFEKNADFFKTEITKGIKANDNDKTIFK